MKSIYSTPKVVKYDDLSKSWFVYFRYDKKLFRYKFGINYINDYKKRLIEANSIRDALLSKLKKGWNPNIPDVVQSHNDMTLSEALDFAILKKAPNINSKTLSGYNGTIKFVKTAIIALMLDHLPIKDAKRTHIKLIIEKAKEQRSWTNNAYNKHLNHLKAILSELIQWDIIDINPAHKIKNLFVPESEANIPASPQDIEIIKKELITNHYNFFVYIITIFHTGIRPEEILKLKLENIQLNQDQIYLPFIKSKNKRKRIVPVNQYLKNHLEKLNINQLPSDYYLFGSFRAPGKGNLGKHDDFIPGPTRIKRDTATKRWKRIIKDKHNIDMNMYAMKHLGADKKILAGVELDSLRELYGHSSKLMTKKYAKVVKEVHRQQILEKSPDF